jgi:hypothetical protein
MEKISTGKFHHFFPEMLNAVPDLFSLDVRSFEDWPPLLDLGLLLRGKRFGRLLLVRRNVLALISKSLPHSCVS